MDYVGEGEGRYVDFVAEDTGNVDEAVSDTLFDHFFFHGFADDVGLAVAVLLDEVPDHHHHRIVRRQEEILGESGDMIRQAKAMMWIQLLSFAGRKMVT